MKEKIAEASQDITDEMLSAALHGESGAAVGIDSEQEDTPTEDIPAEEESLGEPIEDPEKEPIENEEPEEEIEPSEEEKKLNEENAEKSRLGRKVKYLEQKLEELTRRPTQIEPELDDDDDEIITRKNLRAEYQRLKEEEQAAAQAQQNEYQTRYIQKMDSLSEGDAVEHEAIIAEMLSNDKFNRIHNYSPEADAHINYIAAKDFIRAKGTVTQVSPLKGKKPAVSVAVPGQSKDTPRKKTMPKLPPDAKKLMDKMGITEEEAMEALG